MHGYGCESSCGCDSSRGDGSYFSTQEGPRATPGSGLGPLEFLLVAFFGVIVLGNLAIAVALVVMGQWAAALVPAGIGIWLLNK